MANAAKHSGSPDIALYSEFSNGEAHIHVRDSGTGFADDGQRNGCMSVSPSRVESVGGLVEIDSSAESGTEDQDHGRGMTRPTPLDPSVDDHDVVRAGMRAILDPSFDIVGEADNVDSAIELIKERLRRPRRARRQAARWRGRRRDPRRSAETSRTFDSWPSPCRLRRKTWPGSSTPVSTATSPRPRSGPTFPTWFTRHMSELGRFHLTWPLISSTSTRTSPGRRRSPASPRGSGRWSISSPAATPTGRAPRRLGITVKTLENHMAHIFDKLSVASRHELTALAYEEGYVRPDDER